METTITLRKASESEWLASMDFDLGGEQRLAFTLRLPRTPDQTVAEIQRQAVHELHLLVAGMKDTVPSPVPKAN